MAGTKYPGQIDDSASLPDPGGTSSTNGTPVTHSQLHAALNAAVKAIEAKLGLGSSTPGTDGQLLLVAAGRTAWGSYAVGGDLTGSLPNPSLANSGVAPGTYGAGAKVPQITVDQKGRITGVSEVAVIGGGGGGTASSPLTTKGDIWVFSTADTRLPIGSNGFILSVDTTTATGLKWISPPTSAVWGGITGTLSSQTDLQTALNAKANTSALPGDATTTVKGLVQLAGDLAGTAASPQLATILGSSGTTGSSGTVIPVISYDVKGRITGISTTPVSSTGLTFTESQVTNLTTDLAAKLNLAGGTMTGLLILSADPTNALGAVTKQYADGKLSLTGGTLTGALLLAADPTAALGAATKQYVDKLGSTSLIRNETPGGLINGAVINYTTASTFAPGSLKVYLNGQRLAPGATNDYTEGTQGFTMNYAPATGDVLLVDYETTNTAFIQGSNSSTVQEIPSGTVNGSNTVFTTLLGKYVANSLEVSINGLIQARGTDYTETTPGSGIFTFAVAPATGDIVRVNYQFSTGASGNADTVDGLHASTTPTANQLTPLNANGKYPATLIATTSAFSVYRSGTLNIPNGSDVLIVFDTIDFDQNGDYSTSTGRWTAPYNGIFRFDVGIGFSLSANTAWGSFYKNGVMFTRFGRTINSPTGNPYVNAGITMKLNAGDYIQIYATTTTNTGSLETPSHFTYFSGSLVAVF